MLTSGWLRAAAILTGASLLLSAVLTPLVGKVYRFARLLDCPDGLRKLHPAPIPRAGGPALLLAAAFGMLIFGPRPGAEFRDFYSLIVRLAPCTLVIFAVGLLDDIFGLPAWQKFLGQSFAASLAYLAGFSIRGFTGMPWGAWVSVPVTVFWLLACTNALNLMDGCDGLAAGLGVIAAITLAIGGALAGNSGLCLTAMMLAACLVGFLLYNSSPASVFLGDSGSLALGFLLALFGILWSQQAGSLALHMAPLMALSLPLLDVILSIFRRFLILRPVFSGDRGHIHHKLLDRTGDPGKTALILCAASAATGILALACSLATSASVAAFCCVLFFTFLLTGAYTLRYCEFEAAAGVLINGSFRHSVKAQVALKSFELQLEGAVNLQDCWIAIQEAASQCGLICEKMRVVGRERFEIQVSLRDQEAWRIHVPLDGGSLELLSAQGGKGGAFALVPFLETLHRTLGPKLRFFAAESALEPKALAAAAGRRV